jgi:uncharacterized protein YjiS (DUF1127 family)
MTTLTLTGASAPIPSEPTRSTTLGATPAALGVLSLFRRGFSHLVREYRVHCGVRAMMALDDRMLSDIGLARTEIGSAALYGRARSN